ncbi:hypothetical protein BDZ45DRAFT_692678 [Acephala macrosclerotiorum]|nr:hypothetical protein BDZ45DRAFT_692678 [Acephala macrosclerotiorum]
MHLARNNTRPCDARFDAACAEPSITRAKNVQTRFASVAVATILLRSMEADVWLLVAVFIAATSIVLFAAWTRITMPSLRLQFLGHVDFPAYRAALKAEIAAGGGFHAYIQKQIAELDRKKMCADASRRSRP